MKPVNNEHAEICEKRRKLLKMHAMFSKLKASNMVQVVNSRNKLLRCALCGVMMLFTVFTTHSYYQTSIRYQSGKIVSKLNKPIHKHLLSSPVLPTDSETTAVPLCTSQQRLSYIRRQFDKYNMTSSPKANLLVNDEKRLAYCFIAKCGSSTMKRFLAFLSKGTRYKDLTGSIHSANRLRKQFGLRTMTSSAVQKLHDYRKFVVIRNPMDRFLSAFHDKLLNDKTSFYRSLVDGKLRGRYANATKLLKFTKAVLLGLRDDHWAPYARKCQFEKINYDDVIRIESFRHDIKPILEFAHSNLTVVSKVSNFHYRRNSTKASDTIEQTVVKPKYMPEYHQIAVEDLVELKQIYMNDLRLFGYEFDVTTLVASCSMTDERGQTCC